MKELNKKLTAIQQELKAPKNQFNNFGKYNYRSCEDILEGVKPLLKKHELTLRIDDSIIQIGERYYVQATAILSDGENAIVTKASAREADKKSGMDASQITGAASSYARKYALNGLFAIDDTKDADTKDNTPEKKETKKTTKSTSKPRLATSAQIGKIGVLANKELGWSNLKLSKATAKLYKKGKLPDLTIKEASDLIEKLQVEVKKQEKETIDVGDEDHSKEVEVDPSDIDLDLDSVIEEMENEKEG